MVQFYETAHDSGTVAGFKVGTPRSSFARIGRGRDPFWDTL